VCVCVCVCDTVCVTLCVCVCVCVCVWGREREREREREWCVGGAGKEWWSKLIKTYLLMNTNFVHSICHAVWTGTHYLLGPALCLLSCSKVWWWLWCVEISGVWRCEIWISRQLQNRMDACKLRWWLGASETRTTTTQSQLHKNRVRWWNECHSEKNRRENETDF